MRLRNGLWNAVMCTHISEQHFSRGLLLRTCAIITSLRGNTSLLSWRGSLVFSFPLCEITLTWKRVQVRINQFSKGDSTSGLCTLTSLLLVGVDRREENSAYCTPRTRPQECCTEDFSQWQAINERRYYHICLHWRRRWNSCPGLECHLLFEFENLCHQAPHSTRNHRL